MISIHLDDDGTGSVDLPTGAVPIQNQPSLEHARETAVRLITEHAQQVGHAVEARADDVDLTIFPSGKVVHGPADSSNSQPLERTAEMSPKPPPAPPQPAQPPTPVVPQRPADDNPFANAAAAPVAPPSFVRERPHAPIGGVQGVIYKLTGGMVNLGPSEAQQYRAQLEMRIRRTIAGTRNITTMCLKGGASKTTTTVALGLTMASLRPDPVLAIDANPDAGDLADRLLGLSTVSGLALPTLNQLAEAVARGEVNSWVDLNKFTERSDRLHFIASEQDPAESESLTAEAYADVRGVTDLYYPITLTDCGTGVTHPAMTGILANTQQLVIAAGWAVTGAHRAQRTLEWLHNRYGVLARNSIVVINAAGGTSKDVDRDAIQDALGGLCRAVHLVPFDPAIAKGDLIRLDDLHDNTRQAFREVAATIVDAL